MYALAETPRPPSGRRPSGRAGTLRALRSGASWRVGVALLLLAGCGGAPAATSTTLPAPPPFHADAFLAGFALSNIALLVAAEGRLEEAEATLASSRPAERRVALRDLAYAHAVAAETADEADAVRHRREIARLVQRGLRRNRDGDQVRDFRFVQMWSAYRGGAGDPGELALAFTEQFREHSDLVRVAWMIKAEAAFAREDWPAARAGFRFVMADLRHPLYPYALYRTAQVYALEERSEDARLALQDVRDSACRSGDDEAAVLFGQYAWADLGEPPAPAEPPPAGTLPWCVGVATTGSVGSLDH